jgi:hypothetical protein
MPFRSRTERCLFETAHVEEDGDRTVLTLDVKVVSAGRARPGPCPA